MAAFCYLLVSSMAGNYKGAPWSTQEIDFVIEYDETQKAAIMSALKVDFSRVADDE